MDESPTSYERFRQRYAEGRVPWSDHEPPPEIAALADEIAPGRALDLGCGFGRTSIYLAQRGWHVDGVDFIAEAVETARKRAADAGVGDRAIFHVSSAAAMPFLEPPYDLAVDIGCMHSFDESDLAAYRHELLRLLAQGGRYVLFAHLRGADEPADEGPRGIPEQTVWALFADGFKLERFERGMTQVEDRPAWESGWFWYRRT